MTSMVKAISVLAMATGLGVTAVALSPGQVSAACWNEKTLYQGPGTGTPENCMGGTCNSGWCCRICEQIEP
jgi:hypothetical protein